MASDALCDEASKRGSSDNISIMVVMLRDVATSDEVIGYFTARRRGKLGIIFGDSWPCIKKIAASSLAAAQEQVRTPRGGSTRVTQPVRWYFYRSSPSLIFSLLVYDGLIVARPC